MYLEECRCFAHFLLLGVSRTSSSLHVCSSLVTLAMDLLIKKKGDMIAMINERIEGARTQIEDTSNKK